MIHPDDSGLLGDWHIYGPKNPAIFELVEVLAQRGMRVAEIEVLIEDALRRKLRELDETVPASQV